MQPELETRTKKTDRGWQDHDGFIGPIQPGNGPRSDPKGDFPTGPAVGDSLPEVLCRDANGQAFSLAAESAGRPKVLIFFRSAVW